MPNLLPHRFLERTRLVKRLPTLLLVVVRHWTRQRLWQLVRKVAAEKVPLTKPCRVVLCQPLLVWLFMPLDKPVEYSFPNLVNQLVAMVPSLLAVNVLLCLRQPLHQRVVSLLLRPFWPMVSMPLWVVLPADFEPPLAVSACLWVLDVPLAQQQLFPTFVVYKVRKVQSVITRGRLKLNKSIPYIGKSGLVIRLLGTCGNLQSLRGLSRRCGTRNRLERGNGCTSRSNGTSSLSKNGCLKTTVLPNG